jgi:thymidylate synthase ThyX
MSDDFRRKIYLLSQRNLSPETIAVTFAKTSRSPKTFQEIASELSEESSSEFHEKWVVGYGHASVAEHAVLHLAFENVSRLAIESLESGRLASYTEKSTRYQKWNPESFYIPDEIIGSTHEDLYKSTIKTLFSAYRDALEPVQSLVQEAFPQKDGESEFQWENRIRSKYVDVCRFYLPAASLANVGMTVNARALEHALRKMVSHPLSEVRQIGEISKAVALEEVPTLVKYVAPVAYLQETKQDFGQRAASLPSSASDGMLQLLNYDAEAENYVLAAALYEHTSSSYHEVLEMVGRMNVAEREQTAAALLGRLERFDIPLRELEHAAYTFEAVMDQGAYFEVKRHRMMTQTPQRLTCISGYTIPSLIDQAGLGEQYRRVLDQTVEAYYQLAAWNPDVAAYLVPNAANRRVLMTFNLREAYHFCELRSAKNAHFSVRRIALRMAEMIKEVHPLLSAYMRLPAGADWRAIENENFSQV